MVLLTFSLFLATLHPSVTAGDSGEIAAAAFSLGVPHPPGYPLYVIIGKLFSLALPFGSVAYRVNIASAVFGALACMMVYLITERIVYGIEGEKMGRWEGEKTALTSQPLNFSTSYFPALFASFSLAFSYEFWYRSTVAEVYTLNAFLILLIIYVLMVWGEGLGSLEVQKIRSSDATSQLLNFSTSSRLTSHDSRLSYLASFLLGLGIGNHHTVVLVVPGAVAFICLVGRDALGVGSWESGVGSRKPEGGSTSQPLNLSTSLFFLLLGLSVYLFLPIRSVANPFMDWGDPQWVHNFIDVFTRKTYLPKEVGRDWETFITQLKTFNPFREFTVIGSAFGLIGVWGIWKHDKAAGAMILLLLILTSYGLILLAGSSATDLLKKFYLPAYAVFSVFMGVGIATGLKLLEGGNFSTSQPLNLSTSIIYGLAAISLIWQLSTHYPITNNSNNYLAYDYGLNELDSLREGATYISKGEVKTFPLWYLQGVERYREDVKVITAYFLTQRWYIEQVLKAVGVPQEIPQGLTYKQLLVDTIYRRNADKGVYAGFLDEEYMPGNLLTYTQGITFQLYKDPREKAPKDVWPLYQLRGVRKVGEGMDQGMVEILKDYASSHYNTGIEYYEMGDRERAITEFEKALAVNPDDPDTLYNVAVLYAEKGIKLREAEEMARRAFDLYTGDEDKAMAKETLEEVLKKRNAETGL